MKRFLSIILSAALLMLSFTALSYAADDSDKNTETISYTYSAGNANTYTREMEKLDRGLIAISTNSGVYLSWRLLDSEDAVFGSADKNVSFNIYRDGIKIDTVATTTNYTDQAVGSSYSVAPVIDGIEGKKCDAVTVMNNSYFDIPLVKPDAETTYDNDGNLVRENAAFSPTDCSAGDVDGDGEYEIIVKWVSSEHDVGSPGKYPDSYSGTVRFAAYKLDGTKLWDNDINLGKNVYSSAHTVQFLVYDFNMDGKAEMICQTSLGSKDARGEYVSHSADPVNNSHIYNITNSENETADFRNAGWGLITTGEEFLTVFDGETGAAIDTIDLPTARGNAIDWGDANDTAGNRVNRFIADVAYLDGKRPYAVYQRGYYFGKDGNGRQRTSIAGVSFDGERLSSDYRFDTKKGQPGYYEGSEKYVGQGNHNCTVADVDNDGKDEYICGALCMEVDENNQFVAKWCSFREHGDALHIGDYDPTHPGLEYFSVHEDGWFYTKPNDKTYIYSKDNIVTLPDGSTKELDYGMTVYDAATGEELVHYGRDKSYTRDPDTGRGVMANIGSGGYYQISGTANYQSNGASNFTSTSNGPGSNFRIFWDGDLYDELLDGTAQRNAPIGIDSYNVKTNRMERIFTSSDCKTINDTKNNPCLQADLFGDWREEVVAAGNDGTYLRVYSTTTPTEYKMKTLMHDPVYRSGVAAEQTAYNQPPHIGFYIDDNAIKGSVKELQLTSMPKDTYKIGENLDLSGCTITAIYANGTIETADINDCTISGHNPYRDGKQTITVTYKEASISFDITVLSLFEFDSESKLITGYNGSDESIIIPEYIDNITVSGIADEAFANSSIKDVYIYDDIDIGLNAFPADITIHCFEGSAAAIYASENNIKVEYIKLLSRYADVTFDEEDYPTVILTYSTEADAVNSRSIPPLTYYVRGKNDGETSFIKRRDRNSDNNYLQVNVGRFTNSDREPYITFDNTPDLAKLNNYSLSMDFLIEYNNKDLSITLKDEDSNNITELSASMSGLLPDTWYHYSLNYNDGEYTQTITDENNEVIQQLTLDYNGKKAVKSINFPVKDIVEGSNYVYLDNISLTSPLMSTLTVNVADSSGKPVSNANIKLGNDIIAATNTNGQAIITAPVGEYPLTIEHNSYMSSTQNIHLRRDIEIKDIKLTSIPVFDVSQHDLIIDSGLNNNTVICRYNGNEISYPADTVLTVKSSGNNTSNNIQINTPVTLALEAAPTGNGVFAGWFDEENTPQAHSAQTTETFAAGQTLRAVFSPDGNPLIIGESKNSNGQKTVRIFVPKGKQCSVIAADYKPNGELTSVKLKDINVQSSDYLGTIGLIDDNQILKIMIWNSLNNMTPLCSRIYDSSQNN